MRIEDFLAACEKALGYEAEASVGVSRRETRVLDEITRLKKPKRVYRAAADDAHVRAVARDVTQAMVVGEPAARMADRYGISESQARRVVASEILLACRAALGRKKGEINWSVATLQWVANASRDNVLNRARANQALVLLVLEQLWDAQDAQKEKV